LKNPAMLRAFTNGSVFAKPNTSTKDKQETAPWISPTAHRPNPRPDGQPYGSGLNHLAKRSLLNDSQSQRESGQGRQEMMARKTAPALSGYAEPLARSVRIRRLSRFICSRLSQGFLPLSCVPYAATSGLIRHLQPYQPPHSVAR
jgi:hypothetical protein